MKILYSTSATSTANGRDGVTTSDDGNLKLQLVVPKSMGGPGGDGTNPEQLFAAGYSACFLGALRYTAGQDKIKLPAETTVQATVGIGPRDDGKGFGLDVALTVSLPGVEPAIGEALVAKAHAACPYSEATRANLDVRLTIV